MTNEEDGLKTLLPSIDVVAHKEEVGARREAAHLKHANEVRVLAVNVADDLHGRRKFDESGLAQKDFASGEADGRDLGILERDRLCDLACVAGLKQARDHRVNVERFRWRGVVGVRGR